MESYLDSIYQGTYEESVEFDYKDITIDVIQDFKKKPEGIIVFLPSAQNRSANPRIPYFPRWTWKNEFEGYDFLVLSDPVLRKDPLVHSSWFLDTDVDVLAQMADFVETLISSRPYEIGNCLFYGSSMGGFAAISMAALLPGSRAVAEVPQLDMWKFPDTSALAQVMEMLGGIDSKNLLLSRAPERSNVSKRIQATGILPPTLIITNRADSAFSEHVDFALSNPAALSNLQSISAVSLYIDPVHSGHTVLSREVVSTLIREYMSLPLNARRVRPLVSSGQGFPLLEPLWEDDLKTPVPLDQNIRWYKNQDRNNADVRLNISIINDSRPSIKAAVIAFDIENLSESRRVDLGLQFSDHKGIGYFKYIYLDTGINDVSFHLELGVGETLMGIGLLSWESESLLVQKIDF